MVSRMFRFEEGKSQFMLLYWEQWLAVGNWMGNVYYVPQGEAPDTYKEKIGSVKAASIHELKQKAIHLARMSLHS